MVLRVRTAREGFGVQDGSFIMVLARVPARGIGLVFTGTVGWDQTEDVATIEGVMREVMFARAGLLGWFSPPFAQCGGGGKIDFAAELGVSERSSFLTGFRRPLLSGTLVTLFLPSYLPSIFLETDPST
ncbi:hypothetical protein B296_00005504 [Ensete ventricosum]|uniref:Uncharacterized protein n=1 Tax=Ensete ventricosum TaxID=4639 RepID=A0A426ZB66_ENSVE|nr:hypothetical protein B296_00005504 [Ensete ventricosum]